MLVFNSALQILKVSYCLRFWFGPTSRAGRVWLAAQSVWDLGQRYFHIFVIQMMYDVVWKQNFSLINHISQNGNQIPMTSRKPKNENEDRNYGKLASAKILLDQEMQSEKKDSWWKFSQTSSFMLVFKIRDLISY